MSPKFSGKIIYHYLLYNKRFNKNDFKQLTMTWYDNLKNIFYHYTVAESNKFHISNGSALINCDFKF